jgi:hypothetical protein
MPHGGFCGATMAAGRVIRPPYPPNHQSKERHAIMADTDSTKNPAIPDTAHEPHVWHNKAIEAALIPGEPFARFANQVKNLSSGIASLSSLLVENQRLLDNNDPDEKPLFGNNDSDVLQRLVTECATYLNDRAEDVMTWAYEHHTQQGRDERRRHHQFCATARDL